MILALNITLGLFVVMIVKLVCDGSIIFTSGKAGFFWGAAFGVLQTLAIMVMQ